MHRKHCSMTFYCQQATKMVINWGFFASVPFLLTTTNSLPKAVSKQLQNANLTGRSNQSKTRVNTGALYYAQNSYRLKCLNRQTWPEGDKWHRRNILGRQKSFLNSSCSYFCLVWLLELFLCPCPLLHWLIGCIFPRIWTQATVTRKDLVYSEPVNMERKSSHDPIKPFLPAINLNTWSTVRLEC